MVDIQECELLHQLGWGSLCCCGCGAGRKHQRRLASQCSLATARPDEIAGRRPAQRQHARGSAARGEHGTRRSQQRIRQNTQRLRSQQRENTVEYGENTPTITTSVGALTAGSPAGTPAASTGERIRSDYDRLRSAGRPGALPPVSGCSQKRTDGAHSRAVSEWYVGGESRPATARPTAGRPTWRVAVGSRGCSLLRIRCEHAATTQLAEGEYVEYRENTPVPPMPLSVGQRCSQKRTDGVHRRAMKRWTPRRQQPA
jgi:hypothetical protein